MTNELDCSQWLELAFDDTSAIVTSIDPRVFVPESSLDAIENAFPYLNKTISNRSDGFYCKWKDPNKKHISGTDEVRRYIEGYKYVYSSLLSLGFLPDYYLSTEKQKIYDLLADNRRYSGKWLEYYLLNNLEVLLELGKKPRKRQHVPGKIGARLYEMIQDLWASAIVDKNPHSQWMLAYDSPAQIWFIKGVYHSLWEWKRAITPGATPSSSSFCESERVVVQQLKNSSTPLLPREKELTLPEALDYTTMLLRQKNSKINGRFDTYLNARTAQANSLRKEPHRLIGIDKGGQLLSGL